MSTIVSEDEARKFLLENKILSNDELYPEAIAITQEVLGVVIEFAARRIATILLDKLFGRIH